MKNNIPISNEFIDRTIIDNSSDFHINKLNDTFNTNSEWNNTKSKFNTESSSNSLFSRNMIKTKYTFTAEQIYSNYK